MAKRPNNRPAKSNTSPQLGNINKGAETNNPVCIFKKLASAFCHLPDGACIVTDDTIVYINQSGAKIFGYNSVETVPKLINDLCYELKLGYGNSGNSPEYNHLFELSPGEKFANREFVIINPKNFEKRVLRAVISLIESANDISDSSIVIFHDITEQTKAKVALEKTETQFRFVVQNAADVVTVFKADSLITYQSPSIGRVLGRDSKARIGANIFDSAFVHPQDKQRKNDFLVNLINAEAGAKLKDEFRLQHADGTWRDLEAVGVNLLGNPNLQGVILSSRDITERKRAETMLRESEEHFRFMAELLPQKIFTANPEGKVTYFNSQWVSYTGLSLDELKEQGVKQFIHPRDLSTSMQTWKHAIQNGTPPLQYEQRLKRSDGQYRRHISHVRPMYNEAGQIIR